MPVCPMAPSYMSIRCRFIISYRGGDGNDITLTLAMPAAVWVNDNWAITSDIGAPGLSFGDVVANTGTGDNGSAIDKVYGVNAFSSINDAIDAVAPGGTVNVLAGRYDENVLVDKSVEIAGQSQASTIIDPAFTGLCIGAGASLAPGSSNVILVQASNVTIHDLTVNGDNPDLTSGVVVGGADIDARNGIIDDYNSGVYNNYSVHDVTIQNIYLRGLYAASGGTFNFTGNTVDNVQADPSSVAIFNFGGSGIIQGNHVSNASDAIAANWSAGTQFLNNIITSSGSGIHTDNSSGGDLIEGNSVSDGAPGSYGIWTFAPYGTITVRNNTVSNVDVGLTASGSGSSAGNTQFIGNTVDGEGRTGSTGVYVTTYLFGWGDADVNATFNNNVIKNLADGVYVQETGGQAAGVTLFDNSFSGNSDSNIYNAGTDIIDASGNWWGSNAESDITDKIAGSVDYTPWLNSGADMDPAAGFQGDFSYLNVSAASPQTGSAGRIQEAIGMLADGSLTGGSRTIYVKDGSYVEQLDIGKDLTLAGESQAETIIQSPTIVDTKLTYAGVDRHPVVYVHSAAVDIENLTVDGDGQGNGNYRFIGIAYYNAGGTMDHVTVTGVRESPLNGDQQGTGIMVLNVDSALRTVHIQNSDINDYQKSGIWADGTGLTADIESNVVTGVGNTLQIAQNGIEVEDGAIGHVAHNTVSGNEYSGSFGGPDWITQTQSTGILLLYPGAGSTVEMNTVDGNDIGIADIGGTVISGNILGSSLANRDFGILLEDGSSTLSGNSITGGNVGIALYSLVGDGADTIANISGGSISGAGTGVLAYDQSGDTLGAQITLTGGVAITGGATGVLIDGSQASLGGSTLNDTAFSDQSGDYIVLANGAMANLEIDGTAATFGGKTGQQMETADGSTGDFSDLYAVEDKIVHAIDNSSLGLVRVTEGYLYVTPNSYVSPDTRASLGRAVSAAADGDVIRVQSGEYRENAQIVIDKNLSIIGQSQSGVIVKSGFNTTNSGDPKGWFLVGDGVTFNLSQVTLDGNGHLTFQAIRDYGSGLIDHVTFNDIQYNASGGDYAGTAVVVFGDGSHVDITNSIFTNMGREGVLYYGAGVGGNFSGNVYTGKGDGNWLDYAVEVAQGQMPPFPTITFRATRAWPRSTAPPPRA